MKLYHHPVSTTSRPVVLFARESGIPLDYEVVDLFSGGQFEARFAAINPSCQVPVLEDEGFLLTESSAILKYLADKTGSPAYPRDPRQRARVNERMDWFNTGFYRDYSYGFVYPQIFPFMRRPDERVQAGTIAWGREKAQGWLRVLDRNLLGTNSPYVAGSELSIADYQGSVMVLGGEAIGLDFAPFPNVARWLDRMRALPHWASVNEAFYRYVVEPNRGKEFTRL
jgi:glutathione S-transferase